MPLSWRLAGLGGIFFVVVAALAVRRREQKPIVRLNGLSWSREDFCRGWLITGDTGAGKTLSGINQLLFQVFQNEPRWGGICIDDKGIYWETLVAMAKHFNRERDLILLQVRPDNARPDWKPTHKYNLTSAPGIPYSTFAKFVVDSASSLGQHGDKGFFKTQVQTHVTLALEMLYELEGDVTLENALNVLLDEGDFWEAMDSLVESYPTPRREEIRNHFIFRYFNQPPEQMGGVRETIGNYLQCFSVPDIAEVFCPIGKSNTFEFADMDDGKIICVSMPQKYQMERRYVNTFLKMLFYTHVLRRFDRAKAERADDNLLILWADEAQRFVTASEDGMSDFNSVDVIREARATLVAAAQSSTSFIPPLGNDKAKVLTLNLRNRIIFKAADELGAVDSADFLGQKKVTKRSWGYSNGTMTRNYFDQDEHKIKPYVLRHLKKHQCVLVHCENGFKKTVLPPLEPDGKIPPWYRARWF